MKTYIRQQTLTPTQARYLTAMGFQLEHVCMHLDGTDTYMVYVL